MREGSPCTKLRFTAAKKGSKLVKLKKEQIGALQKGLNEVYSGYHGIVEGLNEAAGNFDPKTFTIELAEEKKQQTLTLMRSELSKIEHAVQELKNVLDQM